MQNSFAKCQQQMSQLKAPLTVTIGSHHLQVIPREKMTSQNHMTPQNHKDDVTKQEGVMHNQWKRSKTPCTRTAIPPQLPAKEKDLYKKGYTTKILIRSYT